MAELASSGPTRHFLEEELRHDFIRSVVPLERRRGQVHLTLVWLTGAASFSALHAGYTLLQGGLSIWNLIIAAITGDVLLLAYWMAAARLGSKYGQTATVRARSFMGRWGSYPVSVLYVAATISWYAF